MGRWLHGRLTYANVVATLALFVALGGVSYAALSLPAGSVGTAQLRRGAVTTPKLAFPLGAVSKVQQLPKTINPTRGCGECAQGPRELVRVGLDLRARSDVLILSAADFAATGGSGEREVQLLVEGTRLGQSGVLAPIDGYRAHLTLAGVVSLSAGRHTITVMGNSPEIDSPLETAKAEVVAVALPANGR